MAEKVAQGDFIEIQYTGVADKRVFDTTDKALAQEAGIFNPQAPYGSIPVRVGEGHVLAGLDEAFVGKEVGAKQEVTLPAEKAFGKKDPSKIKLVMERKFKEFDIKPQRGLQVTIDNQMATILTVSGGRCMVDFNHPLAGKDILYRFVVVKKLDSNEDKIKTVMHNELNVNEKGYKVAINGKKATITFPKEGITLPEQLHEMLATRLKEVTDLTDIEFVKEGADTKTAKKD